MVLLFVYNNINIGQVSVFLVALHDECCVLCFDVVMFQIDLPYQTSSRGCQQQIYGAYERSSTDVIEYCSSVSQYAHERCSSIETLIM